MYAFVAYWVGFCRVWLLSGWLLSVPQVAVHTNFMMVYVWSDPAGSRTHDLHANH